MHRVAIVRGIEGSALVRWNSKVGILSEVLMMLSEGSESWSSRKELGRLTASSYRRCADGGRSSCGED